MLKWMIKTNATREERIARTAWLERKLHQEREDIIHQYRTKGFAEVVVEVEVDEDYEHEEETTLPEGDLPRHVGGTRFRPVPVKQAASRSPVRPALATYTPRFIRPSSSKPSKLRFSGRSLPPLSTK